MVGRGLMFGTPKRIGDHMARATKRSPRVAVTFPPELYLVLCEVSKLTKTPKAALVAELMDAALPAVKMSLEALRIVKEQPLEAQRLMTRHAAGALVALGQEQLDFDAAIDARTAKGKMKKRGPMRGRVSP